MTLPQIVSLISVSVLTAVAAVIGIQIIFLLNKLKAYSNSKGKTLIGFCLSDLIPFYVKNGLEIFPDGPDRISFKPDSRSFPGETPGVAVFVVGADGLIQEMKKHSEDVTLIARYSSFSY